MLDFRQLQVFMAVWEKRSLSQAAEAIYLTQPTVSAHLKALEEQVGARLFDRTPREVFPTAAGRLLYPYVQKIIRLNQQAEEALSNFKGEGRGIVSVGASNIPGQYVLPQLLGKFREQRPLVDIRLIIADTANIAAEVLSGHLETGLVGAVIHRKKLRFEPCFNDELVFVTEKEGPLVSRRNINLKELLRQPMIVREKGSGTRLTMERALSRHGISMDDLNIIMEMGSTEAVRQGVKSGLGCALVSSRAVRDDIKCGLLHSLPIEGLLIKRKFFLITHINRTLSPATEAFKKFILEESKKEGT